MIYIKDHLSSDSNSSTVFEGTKSSPSDQSDVVLFPVSHQPDTSSEEIGKWVDKLMKMPEDSSFIDDEQLTSKDYIDPFTLVAEKIIDEEIY